MNTIIVFVAVAIAAVAASDAYVGARGRHYNYGGDVRYFNDRTGNTVPGYAGDQNNDGVNDKYDSNRDGKVDSYGTYGVYGGHGYNRHYGSYGAYNNGYNRYNNVHGLGARHGYYA